MGKKYIIELEEPEMFDERKFYTCSQMPWWAVSENIVENLTPYTEPDTNEVYQRGYEEGYVVGEAKKNSAIQVGDEMRNIKGGWTAVVSNIDGECMTLMDTNGALGDGYDVNRFTKTGRHFPEIAEVLRKMMEE